MINENTNKDEQKVLSIPELLEFETIEKYLDAYQNGEDDKHILSNLIISKKQHEKYVTSQSKKLKSIENKKIAEEIVKKIDVSKNYIKNIDNILLELYKVGAPKLPSLEILESITGNNVYLFGTDETDIDKIYGNITKEQFNDFFRGYLINDSYIDFVNSHKDYCFNYNVRLNNLKHYSSCVRTIAIGLIKNYGIKTIKGSSPELRQSDGYVLTKKDITVMVAECVLENLPRYNPNVANFTTFMSKFFTEKRSSFIHEDSSKYYDKNFYTIEEARKKLLEEGYKAAEITDALLSQETGLTEHQIKTAIENHKKKEKESIDSVNDEGYSHADRITYDPNTKGKDEFRNPEELYLEKEESLKNLKYVENLPPALRIVVAYFIHNYDIKIIATLSDVIDVVKQEYPNVKILNTDSKPLLIKGKQYYGDYIDPSFIKQLYDNGIEAIRRSPEWAKKRANKSYTTISTLIEEDKFFDLMDAADIRIDVSNDFDSLGEDIII